MTKILKLLASLTILNQLSTECMDTQRLKQFYDKDFSFHITLTRNLLLELAPNHDTSSTHLNRQSSKQDQELNEAIAKNNLKSVKEAIRNGANVNNSLSLLSCLAHHCSKVSDDSDKEACKIIDYLLEQGADIFTENPDSLSAFSFVLTHALHYNNFSVNIVMKILHHVRTILISTDTEPNLFLAAQDHVFEKLCTILRDEEKEIAVKYILYIFGDFTSVGFFKFAGIRQETTAYKKHIFIPNSTSLKVGNAVITPMQNEPIIYCGSFLPKSIKPSLKKYFEIYPENMEEYLKNPTLYKKNRPDEFDPVKKFPEDFKEIRTLVTEWHTQSKN